MDPSRDNFYELKDIQTIVQSLCLTETEYCRALSVLFNFKIHLQRPPNLCFLNNYFNKGRNFREWKNSRNIWKKLSRISRIS